ncbi:MAG: T9SS type A sorting domain-containing protein, partial [Cyclobacteriaceae bacterium]|nr:T9SS type A sorting domain-containing protein [Cyclobacteriaceae bacterium]
SKYTLDTEPASAPTGLTFSDLTNSSFKGSFTGVAGASGYLVIRRAGAAPTGLPTDATTYSVNDAIGNGTVVHNGASTTFNQNSLAASTHYYYVVIAYNGSGATINYRTATVLSGSQNTLTTEPIAQPANLNFSGITTNSIGTVSFNGASGAPAGYIALRKAGSAPTAEPVDGTAYLLGDVIGDATVQHLGSALTFAESSLSPGTQYFYKIYSYNGANEFTNYYHPSPLQNSVFTLSAEPTAQPTSLAFTNVLQTTMDVGFTAATPAPGGGYIVLRKAGSSPSADPVDGTVYVATDVIGDATVAYVGTGTTFAESGLSAGTTYYYEVFSFSGSSATVNYLQTSPLSGNKLTAGVVTTPNFQPTGLSFASITNTSYTVTFAEASESPTGYIALRKSGSSPTGVPTDLTTYTVGQTIGDGTVAFVGSTTSFAESGLSSSTSYYYDIFSVNGTGGSEKYRTTTPLEGNVTTYAAEPLAQPTALLFSSVTTTSLTLSYTASSASGYLVIRKSGSAPTSLPSDGVAYSPGDLLGDATVVYAGPLTSINEPTLTSGTDYHYQVFAYNGSANTTNYLTATPLQGNQFLLSIEPTAQPTNLVFSNITTSSFDVTFTLAAGPPDGYIAIGALNTAPTAVPVDGVSYTPGDNIGDGVVAFDVVVGSASISGVLPATEAFLKIYAYKGVGAGRNYLLTSPLTGSVITLAEEPTEQPVFAPFTEVGTTTLRGHLDHPVSVPAGYLIVRKAASAPTGLPEDTVNYSIGDIIGDGIVVSVGSDTTFVDSLLTDNTTYHYRAFSFNGSGKAINYLTTTPAAGSATTLLVPTPTKQAQNLVFSNITGNSITIDFTVQLPAPDGFIVLRKAGSAPASLPVNGVAYAAGDTLGDAVVAYVDLATSGQITVDDIGLLSDTTFYYAIYAYNGDLTATKYLTTSPLTGSQHLLAAEPISQPSGLQFETVTNNSISARFTGSGAERYLVLRKAGSGPSQVPQDSVTYTAPGLLGTDNIIYIGPDTTFTDTGLSAVTQYYYAVFALNGTGVATNYANEAPMRRDTTTLSVEPTAQPTALTFSALSSTGFTVSFTGSGADGYLVLRREGAAVSVNPSDASPLTLGETNGVETVAYVGAGTSFDETGLKVNTAYHYAVFAYNGTGSTTNYLLTSPLIGFESTLPTDNSAPVMTQNNTVASISAGTAVEVSVALNDFETGINQAVVEYRAAEAGGTTWNSGVLVDDGTGTFKFTVPSSSLGDLGLEYRILATNKALMTATFGIYGVTIEKTNGTIVYNSSGVEVGNYRIISVPMELNVKAVKDVFVDLGPYDPKLWRLYHFGNGSLKEISTGGNIEVGSGYWFISKNDVNINTGPGVTVAVDSDSPFQLNLTAGWNQIGNPFPFTINWEKIKTENGFTGEVSGLTKFNGSFVPGSSLSAFEGGFVFAENAITILITPDKTKIGGKIEDEVHKVNNSIDSDYWELELNLEAGEILNRLAGLGMHNKATDEKDGFDHLNLPRFMDYLELNHVKDFMGYSYSKDVVKTKPEHTWEFSLETNVDTDHITLSWDNSYFGNNDKHLFLWDLSANKTIDMRQETTYTFSKSSTGKFKVLYGALDYVQSNLVPDEPVVLNTYPNPFHDEVTIQFALPKSLADHEVTIDIYSSLGVRVGTIFTGRLKPGMHEIRWNGMSDFNTKMAEGMYLIRINTGYQTGFKRIIYR